MQSDRWIGEVIAQHFLVVACHFFNEFLMVADIKDVLGDESVVARGGIKERRM